MKFSSLRAGVTRTYFKARTGLFHIGIQLSSLLKRLAKALNIVAWPQ